MHMTMESKNEPHKIANLNMMNCKYCKYYVTIICCVTFTGQE